ncbi:beta-glucuronidase [Halyomorpha halys]|uniref:beta-glucuronidase n=2 Tax=Halyomorpha halys TaxID=286706 RepID=UPI0034D23B93
MELCWLILGALMTLLSTAQSGILYPRESETRQVKSLDGIWRFRASNNSTQGFEENWFADRLSKFVWYDRTFFVPQSWQNEHLRVWIRFSSVNYLAHVWINGKHVVQHDLGHLPFQQEITEWLNYGTENRITVAVDNTLSPTTVPQGSLSKIPTLSGEKTVQEYTFDFFNYAGIHRSVHLYTTPDLYIDDVTVYTDINGSKGIVYYNITYSGKEDINSVGCWVGLFDADGSPVTSTLNNRIEQNGFNGYTEIPNAKLWWPYMMNPEPGYLYTLEIRLLSLTQKNNHVQDIYRQRIGIRTIHWTNSSFLINGKPVYLRGFGRHEDSDIRGRGLDLPLVTKDYNLLKWIGANSYRTSHYPYAEEIMDFADENGIMIIDECPGVNIDLFSSDLLQKHKDSLTELIQRDKNRPSVIIWSIANEPRTQHPASADYFSSVAKHVKQLDVQRPVTIAMIQGPDSDYAGQVVDILSFNRYNGWYAYPGKTEVIQYNLEAEAERWHSKHNKPVLVTEYGADTMTGLHLMPEYIWSEEYQVELLSEHFKAFDTLRNKNNSFFIGEMIWNFADFKTDQATTRVGGNMKGVFTRNRQPKAAAMHLRKRYMQLAHELDGFDLPDDLNKYTAPVTSQQSKHIEF